MANGLDSPWTNVRIAQLMHLHSSGLSNSEIAHRVGMSRNAVIGKLPRLNLRMWSEEKKAQLARYVKQSLSARQAAEKLGITRSAALCQARRMKLHFRGEPVPKRLRQTITKKTKRSLLLLLGKDGPQLKDLPAEVAANPLSFFDLKPTSCRWPISGDGISTLFCGADKQEPHSYCSHHCCIVFSRRSALSRAEDEIMRRHMAKMRGKRTA